MAESNLGLLIVEDDPAHAEAIVRALHPTGDTYRVRFASTLREARARLDEEPPQLVLADLNLSDGKAFDLLPGPLAPAPFPLLVMTSHGDEQLAVRAMRAGALDYLVKSPEAFASLPHSLERALREWRLREEHRAAEAALRDSEARFRVLFEAAPDPTYLTDAEGRFLDGNRAAEELVGYRKQDLLGVAALTSPLVPDDQREAVARSFAEVFRSGAGGPRELDLVTAAGKRVTVEVRAVPIRHGAETLVLGMARDITERKQAEETRRTLEARLQQALKMEAVGRLAGGVAHDFNNALAAIGGYTELLLTGLRDSDPLHDDLREIQKAAQRAGALTRQLLAFSRQQPVEPQVVELNAALEGDMRMLQRLIGEHVALVFAPGPLTGSVRIDPNQLAQIVMNLAINARDAMPRGGTLTIATHETTLDERAAAGLPGARAADYVVLEVSDTGTGIAPDVLLHVFEPFFTTKPKGRGTGLGLAMVYGTTQQAGGFLDVTSQVAVGTTFRVCLPRVLEQPDGPRSPSPGAVTGAGASVLVCEDEDVVRRLTERFLTRQGFRVVTAASPGDALLLARDETLPIDLLLTDVVMPMMSGPELYGQIAAIRPDLRVLFMSGYADDELLPESLDGQPVRVLPKPFTIEMLTRRVREALSAGSRTGSRSRRG